MTVIACWPRRRARTRRRTAAGPGRQRLDRLLHPGNPPPRSARRSSGTPPASAAPCHSEASRWVLPTPAPSRVAARGASGTRGGRRAALAARRRRSGPGGGGGERLHGGQGLALAGVTGIGPVGRESDVSERGGGTKTRRCKLWSAPRRHWPVTNATGSRPYTASSEAVRQRLLRHGLRGDHRRLGYIRREPPRPPSAVENHEPHQRPAPPPTSKSRRAPALGEAGSPEPPIGGKPLAAEVAG